MRTSLSLLSGHDVFNLLLLNRYMEKQWTVRKPLLPASRDINFSLKTSGEECSQGIVLVKCPPLILAPLAIMSNVSCEKFSFID